ncbi:hypothetical protein ACLQ9J_11140 [Bordetella hinzii]|uniref:hypothetical protein n=1 Tax=Bordetella hinzii TaxID=103855 RepID=UPI0039FD1E93
MDAFPEHDGNTDPSAEPDSAERRRFILATGLAAAGVMSGASVTAAQASGPAGVRSVPARPPSGYNILLIVTDQERHFAGGYPFPVPGRELFDLQADPGEMRNLAVDPGAHREILMAMSGKLNDLIAEEMGVDDGHYLPIGASVPWDTQRAIE